MICNMCPLCKICSDKSEGCETCAFAKAFWKERKKAIRSNAVAAKYREENKKILELNSDLVERLSKLTGTLEESCVLSQITILTTLKDFLVMQRLFCCKGEVCVSRNDINSLIDSLIEQLKAGFEDGKA